MAKKKIIRTETPAVGYDWTFTFGDGRVIRRKNYIPDIGLQTLAALVNGEYTNPAIYLALGTGTTANATGTTLLATEGFRTAISSKSRQLAVWRMRFFMRESEAVGTWEEFAVFIAGTTVADSGQMLNRLVETVSKTSSTNLTVEVKLTFARSA